MNERNQPSLPVGVFNHHDSTGIAMDNKAILTQIFHDKTTSVEGKVCSKNNQCVFNIH